MSDQKLAMLDNAAQAERAARAQPHVDVRSPMTPCPARQAEVFVVPVRYALAPEKASHPCCIPGVTPQSHPMAARRLRAGFIYLWQEKGPLKRYAVSPNGMLTEQALEADATPVLDGTLAGLALPKIHDAWLLYSEVALSPQRCTSLSENHAKRTAHMRHLALRTVANELQAAHCPPLESATEVMAELIPATYIQAMKADQKAGGEHIKALGATVMQDPTRDNIKAYTDAMHRSRERERLLLQYPDAPDAADQPPVEWSAEPWDAQGTQTWLETARVQAWALHPVFACLDDDLGVLRDINHEQEQVEASHEQWVGDNNVRLNIGGFIRSLITDDPSELVATLNYNYKGRDITFTPEQGKVMLDVQLQLDKEPEFKLYNSLYGGRPSRAESIARDARIQKIVSPVRAFIPADLYPEMEAMVREYHTEKLSNLNNDNFSAKVSKYIDLPAMNTWLDTTAPAHYQQVEQRHNALFADRGLYLKRSHSGTWFVDYNNLKDRHWLTELATACLSAQCTRALGAEQYADYVRAPDEGALKQLFHAWTPTLDAGIVSTSRLGEILAALGSENRDATRQLFAPMSAVIADDIASMARDAQGQWSVLVNRLAAALLILKSDKTFSSAWVGILVAARLGSDARLQSVADAGRQVWKLVGEKAEGLNKWVNATGQAIGAGRADRILNSPLVSNSGGVVPLAALLLNILNASSYLSQGAAVEKMDDQRVNDTVSASLYASAALVGVIDNQVRKGLGKDRFMIRTSAAPTLTLFGGVIGGLSAGAAIQEFQSLQIQLEEAQNNIDPWLRMRQTVVGGQVIAYGAQALLGLGQTARALAGLIEVEVAIMRYTLYMGPLNWIIAALGVLYLIAWFFQQTPLQNFLSFCCWSKTRAGNLNPIGAKAQQDELNWLYAILYTPRVSMDSSSERSSSDSFSGLSFVSSINALTIDLPGAEPGTAYLELSMIGDPVDSQAYRYLIKNSPTNAYKAPRPWRDMTPYWLSSSVCQWIPFQEGQGLRLSGPFKTLSGVLSTQPATVSLRLRYHTPLTAMLGAQNFVGGEQGVAFTLTHNNGVIALRNDPTPELDRAPAYTLGKGHPGAIYLQPKDNA